MDTVTSALMIHCVKALRDLFRAVQAPDEAREKGAPCIYCDAYYDVEPGTLEDDLIQGKHAPGCAWNEAKMLLRGMGLED
jgi:hypothetical protein